eukprot:5177391-Pleurochrysis_carterae.AAC.2
MGALSQQSTAHVKPTRTGHEIIVGTSGSTKSEHWTFRGVAARSWQNYYKISARPTCPHGVCRLCLQSQTPAHHSEGAHLSIVAPDRSSLSAPSRGIRPLDLQKARTGVSAVSEG